MTGPLTPPGEPGAPVSNSDAFPVELPETFGPDHPEFGPSVFMADYDFPPGGSVQIPPLPRSDGGLIQSVKTATVQALRDALQGSMSFDKTQKVQIALDYPLKQVEYPSVFVEFSVTKINRSGLGHEVQVKNPETGEWSFIQDWTFQGRITMTILALKSLDRDRLSDSLISVLAFARTPQLLLTRPQADTQQYRSLITALDQNPYVAMTLQLDTLLPGGQQASQGTPFSDDLLTYQDSWSVDMVGQFNLSYNNDGLYTLAEIRSGVTVSETGQDYTPQAWLGNSPVIPAGYAPFDMTGQTNGVNVDYPVM